MERIIVPTKFNKSGKRILTVPLDESKICAPAYQRYRKACHRAQTEWKGKRDFNIRMYIERIADWIASYISRDSTPVTEKYRIAKFLVEQGLAKRGPMNVSGPGTSLRWSVQLGDIPELASIEEETWEAYVAASGEVEVERDTALARARTDCDNMKQALRREVYDHIRQ